jgi:hypothetical protein
MKRRPPQNETMTYLVERVRALVGEHPGITEKYMFGGLIFLLHGRILAGCKKDGSMLVCVGRDHAATTLTRPGVTPMIQNGRQMTGFFWIDAEAIEDDTNLADWLDFALKAVGSRPPK